MNENQLKMKIYMFRTIDTLLVICLLGASVYAIFYAENKEVMLMVCLAILVITSLLGRVMNQKIALLGVQLEILKREKKREEQNTLMSTRHSTRFSTKRSATSTKPKPEDKSD